MYGGGGGPVDEETSDLPVLLIDGYGVTVSPLGQTLTSVDTPSLCSPSLLLSEVLPFPSDYVKT